MMFFNLVNRVYKRTLKILYRRIIMKRKTSLAFSVLLCFFSVQLLTAGGTKDSSSGGAAARPAEILLMSIGYTEELDTFSAIIDSLNAKNPDIHVTLEQVPGSWNDYNQKVISLITAGTPPDIGRMMGPGQSAFVSRGQLLDLTPMVQRDIKMADYYESAFESVKLDGRIYGVPTGIYTLNVYYNKKMFDEAGIPYPSADWNNPWTKEQFLETARKLTSGSGPAKKYGFYANMDYGRSTPFFFGDGGDTFSPDRKSAAMDSKPLVDTYRMLQDLIKAGVSPSPAQLQAMPVDQLFMSGRLGMLIEGEWMMPPFTANKELSFGVAPVPKGSQSATTINYIDQWSVFSGSKHPDEAWKVVKYFIDNDAAELLIKNNVLGIPVNKTTANRMKEFMFNPLSPAEKDVFLVSIEHSKSLYWHPKLGELGSSFWKNADLISLNEITAEEGMKRINKEWNDIIK